MKAASSGETLPAKDRTLPAANYYIYTTLYMAGEELGRQSKGCESTKQS